MTYLRSFVILFILRTMPRIVTHFPVKVSFLPLQCIPTIHYAITVNLTKSILLVWRTFTALRTFCSYPLLRAYFHGVECWIKNK